MLIHAHFLHQIGLWQAGKLMEGHLSDISYEGSVREGRRHGYGVSIQKKNKYEGDWLEDKRNGTGNLALLQTW